MPRAKKPETEVLDDPIYVRLPPRVRRAAEAAADTEQIPLSTWIRNQVVVAVYLSGVKEAPQVVYDGIRHALEEELIQIRLARVGIDALLTVLPELLTTLAPVGDRRNPQGMVETLRNLIDAQVRELLAVAADGEKTESG